ncbi:MAG: hypothetical protein WCV83_00690 [Candidatus Magasanikbacteria bacterium]|jgi:hypothetical protein
MSDENLLNYNTGTAGLGIIFATQKFLQRMDALTKEENVLRNELLEMLDNAKKKKINKVIKNFKS